MALDGEMAIETEQYSAVGAKGNYPIRSPGNFRIRHCGLLAALVEHRRGLSVRVRFTPTARRQFLRGLAYIKQDNPSAALRNGKRAEAVLRRLETHPESGRRIPEFPELPHREIIVSPYRSPTASR